MYPLAPVTNTSSRGDASLVVSDKDSSAVFVIAAHSCSWPGFLFRYSLFCLSTSAESDFGVMLDQFWFESNVVVVSVVVLLLIVFVTKIQR